MSFSTNFVNASNASLAIVLIVSFATPYDSIFDKESFIEFLASFIH